MGSIVYPVILPWPTHSGRAIVDHHLGVTVGAVVVPQGMAYAQLAQLPVEYGLYTSFMGVVIYWFFATSKDITIGVSTENSHQADSPGNCLKQRLTNM